MATYKKLLKNRNGDIIIPVTDTNTDTGWLDCPYYSGYKTGSNTEWSKLQARYCNGQIMLRGSVSKTSGDLAYGTELRVAKLPDAIKTVFAATTPQHLNGYGRAAGNGVSCWTILGQNVGVGSVGDITVTIWAFLGSNQNARVWASPPSIGTTIAP